jgi:hypothetical protein
MIGDENEEDLALEQVREGEGDQMQMEIVGGKRVFRKRKLQEHEDVTVRFSFCTLTGH